MSLSEHTLNSESAVKKSTKSKMFETVAASEVCLLLLVAIIPFSALSFMNVAPLVSGFTPPVFLATIMVGALAMDRLSYRFADPLERRATVLFLAFACICALSFARSIQNLSIFNAFYPEVFPIDIASYAKNSLIAPFLYATTFLYVLKRMNSPAALMRLFSAVVIGMTLFSVVLLVAAFVNSQYVVTAGRYGIGKICEDTVNMHYTAVGTMFELSSPALIYMSIKRRGWYLAAYFLALVAVIIVQARTALYLFAFISVVALVAMNRVKALITWLPVIGAIIFVFLGAVITRLLTKGFNSQSGFSMFQLLSGRDTAIWLPLVVEWLAIPSRFYWGTGFHGMLVSSFLREGGMLRVGEAHNAYLEFFLDNGIFATAILLIALAAWLVWAIRLGKRVKSGTYWVMLLCPVAFLISGMTGRHFFPNTENMMLFPMLGAYVNAARLCLYPADSQQSARGEVRRTK